MGADPGSELGLQLGYALGKDNESEVHGGPGVRLHLLKRLGSHFAVGPEAALYARAGSRLIVSWDGSTHDYRTRYRPLVQIGGVARAGLVLSGVRPSLLLGVGWYQGAAAMIGVSLGAEVELDVTDWLPLVIDARFHENLLSGFFEDAPDQNYRSLGLGTRLTW
ncbi:MAG: hypothetical protein JXB05_07980 [Myxococcaceae bacterium]|nr:hypothetical protein [Myxococcaceae bacterium]